MIDVKIGQLYGAVVQCIGANFVNWLPTLFCGSPSHRQTQSCSKGPLLQGSLQPGRQQWGKWEEKKSLLSTSCGNIFAQTTGAHMCTLHMNADYRETRKAPTRCWWPKHIFKRYPFHSHGMLKSQSMFPLSVPRVIESKVSSKSQYTSSHHKVVVFNFDIDLLPHN